MVPKSIPDDLNAGDLLTERIRESILGVENLREENRRLTDQVRSLEPTNLQLESEVQWLKLALDHERAQRRHYHSLLRGASAAADHAGDWGAAGWRTRTPRCSVQFVVALVTLAMPKTTMSQSNTRFAAGLYDPF